MAFENLSPIRPWTMPKMSRDKAPRNSRHFQNVTELHRFDFKSEAVITVPSYYEEDHPSVVFSTTEAGRAWSSLIESMRSSSGFKELYWGPSELRDNSFALIIVRDFTAPRSLPDLFLPLESYLHRPPVSLFACFTNLASLCQISKNFCTLYKFLPPTPEYVFEDLGLMEMWTGSDTIFGRTAHDHVGELNSHGGGATFREADMTGAAQVAGEGKVWISIQNWTSRETRARHDETEHGKYGTMLWKERALGGIEDLWVADMSRMGRLDASQGMDFDDPDQVREAFERSLNEEGGEKFRKYVEYLNQFKGQAGILMNRRFVPKKKRAIWEGKEYIGQTTG